jgi:hypothetical protein
MKKALLLIAFSGLFFTSCKKEYTCECTVTTSGAGIPTTSTSASSTIKDKKADAKTACENGNSTSTVFGITTTSKCEIK